ncbi:response regulator [Algoriphagus lutimaris]|uniref:response regulator n=1 Tax=Algoriphagus lutimaris TaxID=613197 RepID=UPI00196A544E|nr:response regulator [Algoriphagus lutimaris]MBN3518518.1 response regulator [Algoriphagus lutimaris]
MNNTISKRIASIDDDKIQHILVKKRMQLIDPTVEIFPFDDPENALEWLENNSVDLIFMDLNFPGLSGWDLLQKIREVSQAPVIVLTGNIGPFEREKIEAFPQAIRLFEKPISSVQVNDVFQYLNSKN